MFNFQGLSPEQIKAEIHLVWMHFSVPPHRYAEYVPLLNQATDEHLFALWGDLLKVQPRLSSLDSYAANHQDIKYVVFFGLYEICHDTWSQVWERALVQGKVVQSKWAKDACESKATELLYWLQERL